MNMDKSGFSLCSSAANWVIKINHGGVLNAKALTATCCCRASLLNTVRAAKINDSR
jgi:hypothetical protein